MLLPSLLRGAARAAPHPLLRLSCRTAHDGAVLAQLPKTPRPAARALGARFFTSTRPGFFTSAAPTANLAGAPPPVLAGRAVGGWLLGCATLVIAVIGVGGVTRLTESGLSITEWKPVTGVMPPLNAADWEEEFAKYRATPEFKMLNANMNVEEFKRIYYMEWGHRILGRVIGAAFVLPLGYFALRRRLSPGLPSRLAGLALLLGAQGALGWYMVKSGLADSLLTEPGAVPRVSQYRLAAHLGAALALYAGMFYTGLSVLRDARFARGGEAAAKAARELEGVAMRTFRRRAGALSALVFLTALSGAFVAGLDAGLVYNEFPYMGEHIVPPAAELFSPSYGAKDGTQAWRNVFENPTTVQFDHRVLAMTTYTLTGLFWLATRRAPLPAPARRAAAQLFAMANVQAALGISTLLYLVPVPLAAAHQLGSVALLSAAIHAVVAARRPSAAARAWRAWNAAAAAGKGAAGAGFKGMRPVPVGQAVPA